MKHLGWTREDFIKAHQLYYNTKSGQVDAAIKEPLTTLQNLWEVNCRKENLKHFKRFNKKKDN